MAAFKPASPNVLGAASARAVVVERKDTGLEAVKADAGAMRASRRRVVLETFMLLVCVVCLCKRLKNKSVGLKN